MGNANKEYKDRLFHFLFGREEHKGWTLSLYNAVRGSDYTNAEEIRINTIDDVLYLGMHNDISFLIVGELNLFEQQSSFNPNMPLRMLQYTAKLYSKHVKQNHLNFYGSRLLELPVPKLVVFYNGSTDKPDEMTLNLRDSFPADADPDIAISKTIDEIPEDFLICDLLKAHKAEVSEMLETEYNQEEVLKIVAEDAARRSEKKFSELIKKLSPGSKEYEEVLNASHEKLEELYKKYGISKD